MATKKSRNVSKYSDLTDDERKKKYIELSREWYHRKTPEEKKVIMERNKSLRVGVCDVCGNERVYKDLWKHKLSQAHIRKASQKKMIEK